MKTNAVTAKSTATVAQYMTKAPHTIGENIGLNKAQSILREFHVRHLPVRYGGRLVGVISDRDIRFALSFHSQAADLKVGDIMTERAYAVHEATPLSVVAEHMAQHKIGSAVVVDSQEKVVGIFTTTDALKALSHFSE